MMPFAWRMAWRETRSGWRHFVYFMISIAVGVGALVTVSVFAVNVERVVAREARSLLGGDLEVRLSRPISADGAAALAAIASRGHAVTHVSELIAMAAAAPRTGGDRADQSDSGNGGTRANPAVPSALPTQIVELKAVEPSYPLYGALAVAPTPGTASAPQSSEWFAPDPRCQPACHGALVQEGLLIRLGLRVGDRLKIGQALFDIRGVLTKEPDRMANAFSLGPRVLIWQGGLAAAELIKPGSRVRERYLLRTDPAADLVALSHELRGRLEKDSARVSSYRDAQPQLKRFLDQLTRYLGLIGLTALFVGGIGVATTVSAFIRAKLRSIAILKTLGASTALVIRLYLLQTTLLALAGSLIGAICGVAVQGALPGLLRSTFATDLLDQVDFAVGLTGLELLAVAKGMALGVLTALLFAAWPMLAIREIRPSVMLRRLDGDTPRVAEGTGETASRWRRWQIDRVQAGVTGGILFGLSGLAMWQARSWLVGLFYILGLIVAVGCLYASARGLIRALRALPSPRSLVLRYALGNIHRPGSQAAGILVAVGLALMVIVAVSIAERALLDQVTTNRPDTAPTLFFIDIQPDQRDGVLALFHRHLGAMDVEALPLLRSRLAAVNGETIAASEEQESSQEKSDERRRAWYRTREYVLTTLETLPKDNRLVEGTWWAPGEVPKTPEVSVEDEAARMLNLRVGSTMAVDIQGTIVTATVRSLRHVEWSNMSTNFYMIFSPGSLEGAPFTYVATVRTTRAQDAPLLQAMVTDFPNVTGIHMGDVLESFTRMLDRLALAIRAVAVFCVATGVLVMATALSATRYRRVYESVILKALGATRLTVARTFAWEYAVLGVIAGVIGIGLANVLSWAVLEYLLDVRWALYPGLLLASLLATMLVTVATGFFGSFRILGRAPLSVLRHE